MQPYPGQTADPQWEHAPLVLHRITLVVIPFPPAGPTQDQGVQPRCFDPHRRGLGIGRRAPPLGSSPLGVGPGEHPRPVLAGAPRHAERLSQLTSGKRWRSSRCPAPCIRTRYGVRAVVNFPRRPWGSDPGPDYYAGAESERPVPAAHMGDDIARMVRGALRPRRGCVTTITPPTRAPGGQPARRVRSRREGRRGR